MGLTGDSRIVALRRTLRHDKADVWVERAWYALGKTSIDIGSGVIDGA